MIGFSDSQNPQPPRETDTDDLMYDDEDEEVMATGRLPMRASSMPFFGFMSHSQELPATFTAREQEVREPHSASFLSSRRASADVYIDIVPAEHWHGPNWRNMQFPPYIPDRAGSSRSSNNMGATSSGSESLEQQPQQKKMRVQKRSNHFVRPRGEVQQQPQLPLPQSPQSLPDSLTTQESRQSPPATLSPRESPQSPFAAQTSQEWPLAIQSPQSQETSQPLLAISPSQIEEPLQTLLSIQPSPTQELSRQPQLPQLSQLPLPPQLPPFSQVPDLRGLRELDRNYIGHRYAYVELLVHAWAQGHCQTGSSFAGEEITLMSQLARQSPYELGRSLRSSHSICLQRCPDAATADTRAPRWRMVADNKSTLETRSVIPPNFSMLSQMVATMAQYAAMLPAAMATTNTSAPEEHRPPRRAAAARVSGYGEMLLPDPRANRSTAPRPSSSTRRRTDAAPVIRAPRARLGRPRKIRPTATIEPPVNIEAPVLAGSQDSYQVPENNAHPDMMDVDHGDAQAPVSTLQGKRGKRSTVEEKQLKKGKRADALEIYARYRDKGLTIQDLLASEGIVVRMDSLCKDRSLEQLVATPFVPIVFRALNIEPAHYIVDCRKAPGSKIPNQVQGYHEYGVDGFPVPLVPERWLSHQRRKYKRWCGGMADCKEVQVANSTDVSTCLGSLVHGPPMCRGCVTRQTDCTCRFRWIRVITKLDIVASNNSMVRRYIVAPMFTSQADGATTSLVVKPASVSLVVGDLAGDSTTPAGWSEFYSLYMTAPTLLQALNIISPTTVEHANVTPLTSLEYGVLPGYGCSAAPCVYRTISPGFRQLCDVCATSIMSVCFTCCMCATEMCVRCFSEWDDDNDEPRVSLSNGPPHPSTEDSIGRARRLSHCKMFNGTSELSLRLQAQHKKRQFIRVSQFSAADIHQVLEKVRGVIDLGAIYPELSTISCAGVISDTSAQVFAAKINQIEQRTRDMYPHAAWELPVIYVHADELSAAEFSCLWRCGVVVVVRGLLSSPEREIWQPEWWIKHFGDEVVSILDCANGAKPVGGEWPLRNFYRLFDGPDKYASLFDDAERLSQSSSQSGNDEPVDWRWAEHKACVESGILKLKDWPPTDDFETRLPDHFRQFMDALPFPEYTQREGKFNLVNRLPAGFVPPDLGPKMYCAYGSSDGEGGVGTTNLHCDMADAVNIMAYAPPEFLRERNIEVPGIWTRDDGKSSTGIKAGPAAAAVWDIYPPEAIGDLRTFIGEMVGVEYTADCSGPIAAKHGDPIHNQETYLTQPLRKEFSERYGHKCYRIYQIPGDAVFVPAGCAHQVCNYASAVKIAMDFVSPERVDHSRRLTEEFRQLNCRHPRNRDLLQLGNILWWTFAGKQKPLPKQPPVIPGAQCSEDENRQRKRRQQQQQPKPGRRGGRQAKESAKESGSGSGAKSEPKSRDVSSNGTKRPSLSPVSSLSSSFSIEEADDDDSEDVLIKSILQ